MAQPGVGERHRAVDRVRDAVRAEDLLDHRRVALGIPEDHGDVAGRRALPEQAQDLGAAQLDLGALSPGAVKAHHAAGPRGALGRLEEPALEGVQSVPRARRVVVGHRLQGDGLGRELAQALARGAQGPERLAARLVGQRDRDRDAHPRGQGLQGVHLQCGEVVEAVDVHGLARPGSRLLAQPVQRQPRLGLRVHQPGGLEPFAVAAVDRRHLLGVGAARTVPGPGAQRPGQSRRVHHRALEPGDEAHGRPGEPRLGRRPREHPQPGGAHGLLGDQLPPQVAHPGGPGPGAVGDQVEERAEAEHPGTEHRPAVGQLAPVVLHVLERRDDEDGCRAGRAQAFPERAEHGARLRGVGGPGDEGERHDLRVAWRRRRLTPENGPKHSASLPNPHHSLSDRVPDRLGEARGGEHGRSVLELPARPGPQHPARHPQPPVLQRLDPELLLEVPAAPARHAERGGLGRRAGAGPVEGGGQGLRVAGREDAGRAVDESPEVRRAHGRRLAAQARARPLGQASAPGNPLEAQLVAHPVLVLVRPGAGVRPAELGRAGLLCSAAARRAALPRGAAAGLPSVQHRALRADRTVGHEAVVPAEQRHGGAI